MAEAGPSAVALIETPDSFVLEGRLGFSSESAHPKIQFFGDYLDPLEDAHDAVRRGLREALAWEPQGPIQQLDAGHYDSRNYRGEQVTRHVTLFRATAGSVDELRMQIPGRLVELPKTAEAIEEHRARLTAFTYKALRRAMGLDNDK